jgi:hypothetical protein
MTDEKIVRAQALRGRLSSLRVALEYWEDKKVGAMEKPEHYFSSGHYAVKLSAAAAEKMCLIAIHEFSDAIVEVRRELDAL